MGAGKKPCGYKPRWSQAPVPLFSLGTYYQSAGGKLEETGWGQAVCLQGFQDHHEHSLSQVTPPTIAGLGILAQACCSHSSTEKGPRGPGPLPPS